MAKMEAGEVAVHQSHQHPIIKKGLNLGHSKFKCSNFFTEGRMTKGVSKCRELAEEDRRPSHRTSFFIDLNRMMG